MRQEIINMQRSSLQPYMLIPHIESPLHNTQMVIVDDFFDQTALDIILNQTDWSKSEDAAIDDVHPIPNKEIRSTKLVHLNMLSKETRYVMELVVSKVRYINKQSFMYDIDSIYEPPNLLTYNAATNDDEIAGHYDWHIDCTKNIPRKLSMSVTLSHPGEYEGGELQTHQAGIETIEQKFNRAIIFPSFTSHRVTPVTKGQRRSFVQWFNGPAFR